VSGRLMVVEPSLHVAEPLALVATSLMMHVLVGGLAKFGMGSGVPKRHPAAVQWRVPCAGVPAGTAHPAGMSAATVAVRVGLPPVHEVIFE